MPLAIGRGGTDSAMMLLDPDQHNTPGIRHSVGGPFGSAACDGARPTSVRRSCEWTVGGSAYLVVAELTRLFLMNFPEAVCALSQDRGCW